MRGVRLTLRLSLIALAAILGFVSQSADASTAPRPCCVKRACPAGCCKAPVEREATARIIAAPSPSTCECREDRPAAPMRKPESRSPDRRGDRIGGLPNDLPVAEPSPRSTFPTAPFAAGRSSALLALRSTRLRF